MASDHFERKNNCNWLKDMDFKAEIYKQEIEHKKAALDAETRQKQQREQEGLRFVEALLKARLRANPSEPLTQAEIAVLVGQAMESLEILDAHASKCLDDAGGVVRARHRSQELERTLPAADNTPSTPERF